MKIHFYQAEITDSPDAMSDVLDRIHKLSLEDRERDVKGKTVFLEKDDNQGGLYEMDFTQRRIQNGPGYSKKGKETADFDLEADAGFGEQTAAIWAPKGYLVVQYNHYGVRPSTIGVYLQQFLDRGNSGNRQPMLTLKPVINDNVYAKFIKSQRKTKLSCAIDASTITNEMAQTNIALGTAQRLRDNTSAGKVEISVSLGEDKRGGPLQGIREIVDSLIRSESVSSLKVGIKEGLDATTEVLDLLKHREEVIISDRSLKMTDGLRYDYPSRIGALRREFERWLRQRS